MASLISNTAQFLRSDNQTFLGLAPRHAVLIYVAIPVFLGVLVGWPQAGRTAAWPKAHAVSFWVLMSVGGWWLNDIGSRVIAKLAAPLKWPLWVVLLLGVALASYPTGHYFRFLVIAMYDLYPELPATRAQPGEWSITMYLRTHVYGAFVWTTINLSLFYILNIPRYGFQPATASTNTPTEHSALLSRLPAHLGTDVWALEAEQHYLKVHTALGAALVLYRLSDAVRELSDRGVQVHRSFWVARHAVQTTTGSTATPKLRLRNGLEVPVSRSYRIAAANAGLLQA